MKFSTAAICALLGSTWTTVVKAVPDGLSGARARSLLPGLVEWDAHSLIVRGERIMFLSGEFHPFRLPVPDLWLDIFQKIRAMGFAGVSFYVDWALLEGTPGTIRMDGIFNLHKFFDAAEEAGVYLLARPGPFINAETSGGGFPGWIQRVRGVLRTAAPDVLEAQALYARTVGEVIAARTIPNGPVILFQPENEYSAAVGDADFPNATSAEYMVAVEDQFRRAGMTAPTIDNDNYNLGAFAPGRGPGAVDLYGIDAYPLQYDCANPQSWPDSRFYQTFNYTASHEIWSPDTPFAIVEFQGGANTDWGGVSMDRCNELVNEEAVRVVYKQLYSSGLAFVNFYMTHGGTNWGNLGYPSGFTSYDYGAAIAENRQVSREKYSELRLQAGFFKACPAFLTAVPGALGNGTHGTGPEVAVTSLWSKRTNFYVVRHADFRSTEKTRYRITLATSAGDISVPQLGGQLLLSGRDSKIHVSDLDVGSINLLYTTAEVAAVAPYGPTQQVLVLYGGEGETHEFAVPGTLATPMIVGTDVAGRKIGADWIVQWNVTRSRQQVRFGDGLVVYLLWRNEAYNVWTVELPAAAPVGNYTSPSKDVVVVKAGYLIRSASVEDGALRLVGDMNATTTFEVLAAPLPLANISSLFFNSVPLPLRTTKWGTLAGTLALRPPAPRVHVPSLADLEWRYVDSLPEIRSDYDDGAWTRCNLTTTNNPRPLTTPTSLYAGDYGYHCGSLLYRGHFVAKGGDDSPSHLFLETSGGAAFGHSVWLNDTFLGSWAGTAANSSYRQTLALPSWGRKLAKGQRGVLTVLIDHMGLDENNAAGYDYTKRPRGILTYRLFSGHPSSADATSSTTTTDVSWKMTGNLGGEAYADTARGPYNEGAMFAERAGYHLPHPPDRDWERRSPLDGISAAGVGFYTASFELGVPTGWDVPMRLVFGNSSGGAGNSSAPSSPFPSVNQAHNNYRVQLFVNGYQFGKYVSNLGPQTEFPVPEGILNHRGRNTLALTLWAQDAAGARLPGLELLPTPMPVWTALRSPALSPQPAWERRANAY